MQVREWKKWLEDKDPFLEVKIYINDGRDYPERVWHPSYELGNPRRWDFTCGECKHTTTAEIDEEKRLYCKPFDNLVRENTCSCSSFEHKTAEIDYDD